MYVLARELNCKGLIFPVGSRLSDVYGGGPDDTFYAIVYSGSTRKKVLLKKDDFITAEKSK